MSDQLTPARLRELIAAATPGPWIRHGSHFYMESDRRLLGTIEGPGLVENADLFLFLVNNAPALADALEKAELLEWAIENGHLLKYDRGNESYFGMDIHELRAAKEASE